MFDWLKAILIGVAVTTGVLLVPIMVAITTPILVFVSVVMGAWFFLQLVKPDQIDEDDDDKPP